MENKRMKRLIPAGMALAAVLAFAPAYAEDHGHAMEAAPAATEAMEAAPAVTEAMEAAPVEHTLKDGTTKVVVEGDAVFVVDADGAKTPAPDGVHETSVEGVSLTTKDGMLVKEDAAPAAE